MGEQTNTTQKTQSQVPNPVPNLGAPQKSKQSKKFSENLNIDTGAVKETLINFVVPLVCLLLSIGIGFGYIYPSIKKLPEQKAVLKQRTQLRDTLSQKTANLKRLIDFKSAVDENSALIDKVMVSESSVPMLLDQVNQISTNAGLIVNRLSYSYSGSAESATDYKIVSVALGAEGSFKQLALFLQSTENAARYVEVRSFRYSRSNKEDTQNKYSASFSIDSPYLTVQSSAVTDEPVNLDVTSTEFTDFINKIKEYKYYEFSNQQVAVIEEAKEVSEGELEDETDTSKSSVSESETKTTATPVES